MGVFWAVDLSWGRRKTVNYPKRWLKWGRGAWGFRGGKSVQWWGLIWFDLIWFPCPVQDQEWRKLWRRLGQGARLFQADWVGGSSKGVRMERKLIKTRIINGRPRWEQITLTSHGVAEWFKDFGSRSWHKMLEKHSDGQKKGDFVTKLSPGRCQHH